MQINSVRDERVSKRRTYLRESNNCDKFTFITVNHISLTVKLCRNTSLINLQTLLGVLYMKLRVGTSHYLGLRHRGEFLFLIVEVTNFI